jgi:hypothetical protein
VKKIVFACVLFYSISTLSHVCSAWESLVRDGVGLLGGAARAAAGGKTRKKKETRGSIKEKLVYEPLDKGVYGIPFGTDLSTILKWCKDNSVEISLSTEKTIRDQVEATSRRLKSLTKAYESDKLFLSEMDKLVAEMTTDPQMDALQKIALAQTQTQLDKLKNPSFVYDGTTYFMDKGFEGGVEVKFQKEKLICRDEKIMDSIYFLEVKPSDESKNILAYDLKKIFVLFSLDENRELKSYSTISYYSNPTRSKIQSDFEAICKIISEKYGSPIYFDTTIRVGMVSESEMAFYNPNLFEDLYQKTGFNRFKNGKGLFWRNNIVAVGEYDEERGYLASSDFFLVYYEPEIAAKISEKHQTALKEFVEKLLKKQAQDEIKARDHF